MQDGLRQHLVALLPRLRRFARGLTGADGADDLVRAACERALARQAPWPAGGRSDGMRLDGRMFRTLHALWLGGRGDAAGADPRAPAVADGRFALDSVRRAMERLSDGERAILLLACVEGLTYRECAGVLGIAAAVVPGRLAAARLALCRLVENPMPAEEQAGGGARPRPWDDGVLVAYVDGELDDPTARTVEGWAAEDADTGFTLRRLHDSAGMLRAAFGGPVDGPLPEPLRGVLEGNPVEGPAPEAGASEAIMATPAADPVAGQGPLAARRMAAAAAAVAMLALATLAGHAWGELDGRAQAAAEAQAAPR